MLFRSRTEDSELVRLLDIVRTTVVFCGEEGYVVCVGDMHACHEPCPLRNDYEAGVEVVASCEAAEVDAVD